MWALHDTIGWSTPLYDQRVNIDIAFLFGHRFKVCWLLANGLCSSLLPIKFLYYQIHFPKSKVIKGHRRISIFFVPKKKKIVEFFFSWIILCCKYCYFFFFFFFFVSTVMIHRIHHHFSYIWHIRDVVLYLNDSPI